MVFEHVSYIEGVRNQHVVGKFHNIGIVIYLPCDSKWSILVTLQFAIGSSGETVLAQMCHD
jgi:hypothetical protein